MIESGCCQRKWVLSEKVDVVRDSRERRFGKTARQTFLYAVSSIVLHQCRDYFPSLEKAGAAVNLWTVEPTEASTEVTPSNWEQLGATGRWRVS